MSLIVCAVAFAACSSSGGGGGGGNPPPPGTSHLVDLSWTANRESGVNKAGGGYRVSIGAMAPIDVPWVSGSLAPTSISTTLSTGSYGVTVRAYAALDTQGGLTGATSAPSQTLTVNVP